MFFRINDSAKAIFEFENFYFEITKPILEGVKITYDDAFNSSQIVTNQVKGIFYQGSDNIIAGKLLDQNFTIEIEGNSELGVFEKTIQIPAKKILELPIESDLLNGNRKISVEKHKFNSKLKILERLWAYLTLKNLLSETEGNKINIIVSKTAIGKRKMPIEYPQLPRQKMAEQLAKKYNFVTHLTSFVITTDNISKNNTLQNVAQKRLISLETSEPVTPSHGLINFTIDNGCNGTLELFSQTYLRGRMLSVTNDVSDLGLSDSNEFSELVTSIRITGN
jgi:hypothetical protein